jgi:hypothetical protein
VIPCTICKNGTYEVAPCTLDTNRVCSDCKPGSYYLSGKCQPCEPEFYCNKAMRFACPSGSMSVSNASSITDCYCKPGYILNVMNTTMNCTACPIGATCSVGSTSFADCTCKDAGYFGAITSASSVCSPCPFGSTSPVGALSYTDCKCKDGFMGQVYSDIVSTCTPCAAGETCVVPKINCKC